MTESNIAVTPDQAVRDIPIEESAGPVQPSGSDRVVSLDFIRGIAVLGILFANITAFGQPYVAYLWPPAISGGMTAGDQAIWLFQFVLVDGKFRGLFTILFGAGIYLFMERAWARGKGKGLQARRLFFLLCFGLIHYFLIWRGDILTLYAVWGLVALLMIGWKAKTQLVVGLIATTLGSLLMAALMAFQFAAAEIPQVRDNMPPEAREQIENVEPNTLASAEEEIALYQDGSYGEIVESAVKNDWGQLLSELLLVGPVETIGLILIGMGLYRMGLFTGGISRRKLLIWGWIGLIVGLVTSFLAGQMAYSAGFPFMTTLFVFNGLGQLPHLITVLGVLFLLALWGPSAAGGWLGRRFVAAGRMAFSNYLGTSIVMMFVFHGWAGGLFGQLHRLELLGIVVAMWLVMLLWSKAWLSVFRFGPLEWVWRCLTYGKLFPIRRTNIAG
ncbi:MAG: hypothetical protein CL807_09250 [Citromicrobium sp.]|nr:hypothetical protein [Citromicrobium sp.]MAO96706.1 hypothetical protein [Citromicrobium sp.]MAS85999.1 hypothetical protein [Erythrobacteraceae bacterium]MBD77052.1 hypothetical protein [Citromicrobium sp.]MBT47527.1 hypothetical protein [Citromicrobium sp.]